MTIKELSVVRRGHENTSSQTRARPLGVVSFWGSRKQQSTSTSITGFARLVVDWNIGYASQLV